jgi:signal transduction histidine kinase
MNAQSSDNYVSLASYQQLMTRYEQLMEISRQLNSTLDLDALLKRIVTAAIELTETEQASILLVDPSTGELRFEAASNMSRAEMEAIPVPMRGSLAGWVVTHGEPVLVEDARSDARWFARVDKTIKFTTRNVLAVPMNLQNKPVGVVEAINKRNDVPWTEDDVNTLLALANQAATAIQNARLFQQSDFIAEMVHELRTPLAALKASTALLLRPSLPEGMRQEIVQTMQQETERLTALTTDFLDLARLESGRTRLQTRVFDVRDLLEECVGIVAPRADERDIHIEIHGESLIASADRDKIKQVVLNLLTNAIKYNREHGAIYCTLEASNDPSTGQQVISVQDTGHGISEEDQRRVFEKFFRVADTSGQAPGTGLGLSIAKRIVEAHGCDMWLTSELGVGTTFYFTLPQAESASPHDKRPPDAEVAASGG